MESCIVTTGAAHELLLDRCLVDLEAECLLWICGQYPVLGRVGSGGLRIVRHLFLGTSVRLTYQAIDSQILSPIRHCQILYDNSM